jgi:hypothetical protein
MAKQNFIRPSVTSRPHGKRYGTNKELAHYIGKTEMTVWRWKNNPKLGFPKGVNVNGRELNDFDAVDHYLARRAAS